NLSVDVKSLERVFISQNEKQNRVLYGDILFTTSSETAKECGYASVVNNHYLDNNEVYLNSFCFGYRLFNIEKYNVNYFKFLFKSESIRKQIIKCVNGVTRFNLSKELFKKIIIPVPHISIQNKIVEILDKLETYTKDIQTGLPLEINQRHQQYEYYRNKLLDFEKFGGGGN
uniref:restriction endonuclease subunit S n=1 Tax=Mycoplasmopsis primatum TaxID=55604 RepID=UPI000496C994